MSRQTGGRYDSAATHQSSADGEEQRGAVVVTSGETPVGASPDEPGEEVVGGPVDPRASGEAVDELIVNLSMPFVKLLVATLFAVAASALTGIAAWIGFTVDSEDTVGKGVHLRDLGTSSPHTNLFPVLLLVIAAFTAFTAIIVYIDALMGLVGGLQKMKSSANSRLARTQIQQEPPRLSSETVPTASAVAE